MAVEYKLNDETLYLAVNYVDRFLSQMAVLRGKLQLVGTAAMLLARYAILSVGNTTSVINVISPVMVVEG